MIPHYCGMPVSCKGLGLDTSVSCSAGRLTCVLGAGAITPLVRRREIYAICRHFDILILEDDPYFYLQFSTAHGGEPKGLNDLGCSYLSMDVDSRVIRLDSFSKASHHYP